MVALNTGHGTTEIPDVVVRAVARFAEQRAEAVAAYLDATGLFSVKPVCLPPSFLLELGAVLQLATWERSGLREHLDANLPSAAEAAGALGRQVMAGAEGSTEPNKTTLHRRVLTVWVEHFAWDGPQDLQADVLLGHVDEDCFAEALADFVWQHRHELSKLLNQQP